ncbi:hypothetical protein AAG747_25885 [Rapidithrix thailandica]|uniref:Uncharacterized protein n=1 Tax=Rapidithrix thailandica TaxID=413964 RepID=A0AAW9SJM5_9BACT
MKTFLWIIMMLISINMLASPRINLQNGKAKYINAPTLSVKILYFKAAFHREKVHISWATEYEKNNEYFMVEASRDGKSFYAIQQVYGAVKSTQKRTYELQLDPEPGKFAYYRLRQTNYNGTKHYSPVVKLNLVENSAVLDVYQDVFNKTFMTINSHAKIDGHVSILGGQGRPVTSENTITETEQYTSGTYKCRIELGGLIFYKD